MIISVYICSQKKLFNMSVNSHAHRQYSKYVIQHILVHIYCFFSQKIGSELKKFSCFHCPKLVVGQQFKEENTAARRECQDVHDVFSEFCGEEQRPHLCSTSPLWRRCVDSSRHLDQSKFRVAVCSRASKELVTQKTADDYRHGEKNRAFNFILHKPDLN